ncbi:nucleolar pre-ribosomal-associated protein 1 [Phlyctochytrium planicorne]|nr:nucleolar pre-ribosomal-associated protein 1 [Phlyctochytrium planicorne]
MGNTQSSPLMCWARTSDEDVAADTAPRSSLRVPDHRPLEAMTTLDRSASTLMPEAISKRSHFTPRSSVSASPSSSSSSHSRHFPFHFSWFQRSQGNLRVNPHTSNDAEQSTSMTTTEPVQTMDRSNVTTIADSFKPNDSGVELPASSIESPLDPEISSHTQIQQPQKSPPLQDESSLPNYVPDYYTPVGDERVGSRREAGDGAQSELRTSSRLSNRINIQEDFGVEEDVGNDLLEALEAPADESENDDAQEDTPYMSTEIATTSESVAGGDRATLRHVLDIEIDLDDESDEDEEHDDRSNGTITPTPQNWYQNERNPNRVSLLSDIPPSIESIDEPNEEESERSQPQPTTNEQWRRPLSGGLPEEVMNNLIRLAMLSALRQNLMRSTGATSPTSPAGPTDPAQTIPRRPPLQRQLPEMRQPPPIMLIGVRTEPVTESSTETSESRGTGDTSSSGSTESETDTESSERRDRGPRPGPNPRFGWRFFFIAGGGPPFQAPTSGTASQSPSSEHPSEATVPASQTEGVPELPERSIPPLRPDLFSSLNQPQAENLAPPALGGDGSRFPQPASDVESEGAQRRPVDESNRRSNGNDLFAAFLVNLIARMVRDEAPLNMNPNTTDYEELLRLAELIGPARPRNASREDVEEQLPIVKWYPISHETSESGQAKTHISDLHIHDTAQDTVTDRSEVEPILEDDGAFTVPDRPIALGLISMEDETPTLDDHVGAGANEGNGIEDAEEVGTAFYGRQKDHTSSPPARLGVQDLLASTREKCTICLFPYELDDSLRILNCCHGFHAECIDQVNELREILSSQNVEVLFAGLTRLDNILKSLMNESVDRELSDESKLVRDYFKSSPECEELVSIWNYQIDNSITRLDTLIIEVLNHTIVCSKILGGYRSVGVSIVKFATRNKLRVIYRNLSSRKQPLMHATLKLLKSMALQSSSATRELYENFNFTLKVLNEMLKSKKKPQPDGQEGEQTPAAVIIPETETVRDLYIQFLLAFLSYGDSDTKIALLESKGGLGSIFKNIRDDSLQTVYLILSMLRRKVLDDLSIPKNVKVTFFNGFVLEQITKLYSRPEAVEFQGSNEISIAKVAHEFLRELCTKPGVGICFKDRGWLMEKSKQILNDGEEPASRQRQKNGHLLRWARFLRPNENDMEMEILLEFLQNFPSMVPLYIDGLSLSFEPRLSNQWLENMALVAKIIRLPVPDIELNESSTLDFVTISESVLPICLTRSILSRGLQHKSKTVRNSTAMVLSFALARLNAVKQKITELSLTSVNHSLNFNEIFKLLLDDVCKRIPDFQTIVGFRYTVEESAVGHAQESTELTEKEQSEKEDNQEDEDVTEDVLKSSGLQLLRLYAILYPNLALESRFDFGKFIPDNLRDLSPRVRRMILTLIEEVPGIREECNIWLESLLGIIDSGKDFNEKAELLRWFDELLQLTCNSNLKFYDRLSAATVDAQLTLSEFEIEQQKHVVSQFGSGRNLPFSIAVPAALERLGDLYERNFSEKLIQSVYCYCSIVFRRILLQTQASAAFFLKAITVTKSFISDANRLVELNRLESELLVFTQVRPDQNDIRSSNVSADDVKRMFAKGDNSKSVVSELERLFPLSGNLFSHFKAIPRKVQEDLSIEFLLSNCTNVDPSRCKRLCNIVLFYVTKMDETLLHGNLANLYFSILSQLAAISRQQKGGDYQSRTDELILGHPYLQHHFFNVSNPDSLASKRGLEDFILDILVSAKDPQSYKHYVIVMANFTKLGLSQQNLPNYLVSLWEKLEGNIPEQIALELLNSFSFDYRGEYFSLENLRLIAIVLKSLSFTESQWISSSLVKRISKSLKMKSRSDDVSGLAHLAYSSLLFGSSETIKQQKYIGLLPNSCQYEDPSFTMSGLILDGLRNHTSQDNVDIFKQFSHRDPVSIVNADLDNYLTLLNEPILLFELLSLQKDLYPRHLQNVIRPWLEGQAREIRGNLLRDVQPLGKQVLYFSTNGHAQEFLENIKNNVLSSPSSLQAKILPILRAMDITLSDAIDEGLSNLALDILLDILLFVLTTQGDALTFPDALKEDVFERAEALIAKVGRSTSTSSQSSLPGRFVDVLRLVLKSQVVNWRLLSICNAYISALDLGKKIAGSTTSELIQLMVENESIMISLGDSSNDRERRSLKIELLKSALQIILMDPEKSCHPSLLSAVAKGFDGTVSEASEQALKIFTLFEKLGHISISSSILRWSAARTIDQRTDTSNASTSITPYLAAQAIESLNAAKLETLIHNYPISAGLNDLDCSGGPADSRTGEYFIGFVLPFISQCVSIAGRALDLLKFVENNTLGVVVASLSSIDKEVRQAAFYILDTVYPLYSESESLKEGTQIMLVLSRLKNTVTDREEFRIPTVTGIFLAEALKIMTRPDHSLYPLKVLRILTTVKDIPMFYSLFNSTSEHSRLERQWLLRLLAGGMRCIEDYNLYRRRFVIDMLFSYYNSGYADASGKKCVLELLVSLSLVPSILADLALKHSLMPFLLSLSDSASKEIAVAESLAEVLDSYSKAAMGSDLRSNVKERLLSSLWLLAVNTLKTIAGCLRNEDHRYLRFAAEILGSLSLLQDSAVLPQEICNITHLDAFCSLGFVAGNDLTLSFDSSGKVREKTQDDLKAAIVSLLYKIFGNSSIVLDVGSTESEQLLGWSLMFMVTKCRQFTSEELPKALCLILKWLSRSVSQSKSLLSVLDRHEGFPSLHQRVFHLLASVNEALPYASQTESEIILNRCLANYVALTDTVISVCTGSEADSFSNDGPFGNFKRALMDKSLPGMFGVLLKSIQELRSTISSPSEIAEGTAILDDKPRILFLTSLYRLLWGLPFDEAGDASIPHNYVAYFAIASKEMDLPQALIEIAATKESPSKRKKAEVTSDLDIFVINKEKRRQRRLFRVPVVRDEPLVLATRSKNSAPSSYVEVEVFINPPSRMIEEIKSLEDPTVHAWRQGHVLNDDDVGTLASIKKLAIETFKLRKPGIEGWSKFKIAHTRYLLFDQLHDAWDAIEAGDAASGSLMLMKGLSAALEILYSSRGWWDVKEKKRLKDLSERAVQNDETARRVLPLAKRIARGDLESVERHASLDSLVEIVLEPFGGPLVEWTTEWEDLR